MPKEMEQGPWDATPEGLICFYPALRIAVSRDMLRGERRPSSGLTGVVQSPLALNNREF
jgi:hypothetical protein